MTDVRPPRTRAEPDRDLRRSGLTLTVLAAGPSGATITATGEIDLSNADLIISSVDAQLHLGRSDVRLDLGGVGFAGCAALNAFVRADQLCAAASGQFTLAGVRPYLARIMRTTGLDGALRIAPAPAVARVRPRPAGTPPADPHGVARTGAGPPADASQTFADLVRTLGAEADLDGVLQQVVTAAVRDIPGARHAGITVLTRRSATSPAATSDVVREVDRAQYEARQGPCLDAAGDMQEIVLVDDLSAGRRWPRFAATASGLGIASMLSFRLSTAHGTIGALNLYAEAARAFDGESIRLGRMFATHAAAAIDRFRTAENLAAALASRDVIGQAKGILVERYKVTGEAAFDLLKAASQQANRKLHDIAAALVATGELPDPSRR